MKKRGEMYSSPFRYFLIAFIAVMILVFGINSIMKLREKACTSEMVLFKEQLKGSVEEIRSQTGSVKESKIHVPCNVEEIYFVDSDRNMSALNRSLYMHPTVKYDIAESGTKNVFMVKKGEILESLDVGDITLNKPHFVCSDTSRGNLNLYLGGNGTATDIANRECVYDCTFEVIEVDEATAEELIEDAIAFDCNGCPEGTSYEDYEELFTDTNQKVRVARRCNCGMEPGQAVIEILIKPDGKLEHFKLIEKIPKDLIDNLDDYLEDMSGDYDYVKILSDPLIMWHFNTITEDTVIKYTLDLEIQDYCAEVLKTVPLAVTLESEGENPDEHEEEPPVLRLEDVEMDLNSDDKKAFDKPVWHYLSDADTVLSTNDKKSYTYEISSSEGSGFGSSATTADDVTCKIEETGDHEGHIRCNTPGHSFSSKFWVKVSDADGEITKDDFTVEYQVDCSQYPNSETECTNVGCNWCTQCDGYKWSQEIADSLAGGSVDGVCSSDCSAYTYVCDTTAPCFATCDSSTICNMEGCNGCSEGIMRLYDDAECSDDCTCPDCNSVSLSYTEMDTDQDQDGYNEACEGDCDDNNEFKYLNNEDPYCDCDPANELYSEDCNDAYDNDCDGDKNCEDSDCRSYTNPNGETCCIDVIDCDDNNECTEDSCDSNNCVNLADRNGEPCTKDGSSGTCDANGECVLPCLLTNAYWSTNSAVQGDTVTLTVEGDNCNGKTVNFEVWEDDTVGNDAVSTNPNPNTFSGTTATTEWTAEWQCDGPVLGTCTLGDPEYYFIAKVEGAEIESDDPHEELTVIPACTDSDGDGYGAEGTDLRACSASTSEEDCDDSVSSCNTDCETSVYLDSDSDTYGDPSQEHRACDAPSNYVSNNDDCDDTNADVYLGTTESQSCGNCGTQTKTCQNDGTWSSWGNCEGQGVCSSGSAQSCGNCGTQTCGNDCQWESCTGEGVCTIGQTESQSCGNCGSQTRTCGSSCQWDSWGNCEGEGECSPDTTRDTGIDDCYNDDVYNVIDKCSSSCQWYDDGDASDTFVQDCGVSSCDGYGAYYCITQIIAQHDQTCYTRGCSGGACYSNPYTNSEIYNCEANLGSGWQCEWGSCVDKSGGGTTCPSGCTWTGTCCDCGMGC